MAAKSSEGAGWSLVKRCPACGRDEALCTCEPKSPTAMPFGKQRPRFRLEKRCGKPVTVITHLVLEESQLKSLASQLKARLGVGGTMSGSEIELQGDHREALAKILSSFGFRS